MAKRTEKSIESLVIVESPSKARTINKYLGPGYNVKASMGHVRDLPPHDLGIDIENRFEPSYQILDGKKKVVDELRKAAKKADRVYLATDLDREGEAIAWHLVHALDLDESQSTRVVFNEITKAAILHAFANPHKLNMDKVNAQQARRLLDRLVGYQLSPLLQRKLGKGLSAGRVQSVAVRLIVEREREIRAFMPEESWRIFGCFATDPGEADGLSEAWAKFLETSTGSSNADGPTVKQRNAWLSEHRCLYAELIKVSGKNLQATSVDEARPLVEALGFETQEVVEKPFKGNEDKGLKIITLQGGLNRGKAPKFAIKDIQTRKTTSKPSPPFTTATLQQAASSAMGFGPSRTMRVAQQLYEGVDVGEAGGPVGLITYMRTDSTNLSKDSVKAARSWIQDDCGEKYLPQKPNVYSKAKRAQEAHEAIRPSDVNRTPESVKSGLSAEQYKLYNLIWRRFVACQMTPARWDATTILLSADTAQGELIFRAGGRHLTFDGFLKIAGPPQVDDVVLPPIEIGAEVAPLQVDPKQQYTSPPPRYSEASLVKKLEAEGIGRPSTYAAIIQTVQDRGYAELIDKSMHPTARGEVVTDRLVEHFPRIMDLKFTSYMEDELDKIEDAHLDWVHVLNEFYEPFKESLDAAQDAMQRMRAEPSDYTCNECGKPMVYRLGKNGRFLSCSTYPDCRETLNIDRDGKPIKKIEIEEKCPDCGKKLALKSSRMGHFLGCSGYPDCTFTKPSDERGVPLKKVKPEDVKATCEECGSAMAVKFARGKAFLGCNSYPKCKATAQIPEGLYVEKPKPEDAGANCDKCGRRMVIRKGRRGPFLSCIGFPKCRNAMPLEKLDHLKQLAADGKIPDAPVERNGNGRSGAKVSRTVPRTKDGKVDIKAMGEPPPGFAWTRTGRPVVEVWPEEPLVCPDCGGEATMKTGRFGPYYGCSNYPRCSFAANLRGAAKKRAEIENPAPVRPKPIPTDIPCEECGEPMVIRTGRSGAFLGCSKYPKCKTTKPLPEGESAETLAASK